MCFIREFHHNYSGRERNNDFVVVFLKDKETKILPNRIIDILKILEKVELTEMRRYQILDCL